LEAQSLTAAQPSAPNATSGGGGSVASESAKLNALLPTPRPVSGVTAAAAESALATSGVRGSGTKIATDGRAEAELIAREQKLYQPKTYSGPPTKVSLFGSPAAEGRSFVFVLDRSASTGGQGLGILDAAQEQLVKVVAELGPTHRFQIIAYNQKPHYLGPQQMTLATVENKPLVAKFFQTVGAYGSTDHEMALRMALKAAPDVIFLMTDGGDPFLTPYEIRRIVEIAGGKTTIHGIQFGRGEAIPEGAAFMQRLASETGGSYTFVDANR
ncbi:MAG TPA: VWA domain-containing protein, partial [Pirellulaceae bacterium]|nr:VWA domain-containing protein [Pirellulaceae bacterium]